MMAMLYERVSHKQSVAFIARQLQFKLNRTEQNKTERGAITYQSDCLTESLVHFKHYIILQDNDYCLLLATALAAVPTSNDTTLDAIRTTITTHCSESVTKVILIIFIYGN